MESIMVKKNGLLFLCLVLLVGCRIPSSAQQIPDGGENIINYQRLKKLQYEKSDFGRITSNDAATASEITLTVETLDQPKFIYNLSNRIPLHATDLKKGSILLLSFTAKTIEASLETGEARCYWLLNVSEDSKKKIVHTTSISGNWQDYYIPILVPQKVKQKDLYLTLQFGFPKQKFLLKNLSLQRFDENTALADLPKTKISYRGMEADASWRQAAAERIEQHRKGPFKIQFMDKGKALSKTPVQLTLKRHYFSWGAAINAKNVVNSEEHLQHFSKAFNLAVFENDLKIKFWNKPGKKEQVLEAIRLLEEKNIDLKGHVLIWPGFRHLTPDFEKLADDPKKITKKIENHVEDILETTKGKISRWDVVNEAYTNRDLQQITGSEEILYKGFRKLAKKESQVLRYTNEYGIISKGGLDKTKQEWYYDYIQRIDQQTDGLVDGIGIQCHIGSDLTPPEKVFDILNYYAPLDKTIAISEFTVANKDPEILEQYTRDFLTIAFSHPSVNEFLFWGYYQPQSRQAALFTKDWQPTKMGKAYFDLVHGEWKTNLVEKTDQEGRIENSGFYGTYEYTLVQGDRVIKGTFDFFPGDSDLIKIKL